jgi:hypothetical protein
MHTRHCAKLAARMHQLLLAELGQGLDSRRMLAEPLYARDVLLVCEALRGSDGPLLARAWRRAAAAPDETTVHAQPGAAGGWRSWLGRAGLGVQATFSSRSNSAPSAT